MPFVPWQLAQTADVALPNEPFSADTKPVKSDMPAISILAICFFEDAESKIFKKHLKLSNLYFMPDSFFKVIQNKILLIRATLPFNLLH